MGLANAVSRLKDSKAKSKVIILLTDGSNNMGDISPLTSAQIPIYHAEGDAAPAGDDDEKESFGHKVYKHLMNGVSHMLPFVVGGGVLIALGFLIDTLAGNANAGGNFGQTNPVAAVIFWIGKAAFSL